MTITQKNSKSDGSVGPITSNATAGTSETLTDELLAYLLMPELRVAAAWSVRSLAGELVPELGVLLRTALIIVCLIACAICPPLLVIVFFVAPWYLVVKTFF